MASALLESFDGLLPSASILAMSIALLVVALLRRRQAAPPKPPPPPPPPETLCPVLAARSKEGTTTPPEVAKPRTKARRASAYLEMEADDASLWDVGARGFLPARAPQKEPSTPALRVLRDLGREVPSAALEESIGRTIQLRSAELEAAADAIKSIKHDEDELEVAHALYSYICCALVKESSERIVPRCLARGFCAVSRRLGRRPMLDYSGCVLYNWALLDEKGPVSTDNARMLRRFTGLVDEEWFFKTHLVIEAAAAPAVAALNEGADVTSRIVSQDSIQDCHEVLSKIEDCFGHVVRDCLPLMFERHGQHGALCDYYFFYARLRPFINGLDAVIFEGEFDNEPVSLPGPSGAMSTLLPALDAFLGVSNSNRTLQALLDDFSESMPVAHRRFLRKIRQTVPCRDFVLAARDQAPPVVDDWSGSASAALALAAQYNRCVDVVLDFRWRHMQMVRKYVLEPAGTNDAVGTGGTAAFSYLHEHISDTEAARVSVLKEGPTTPKSVRRSPGGLCPFFAAGRDAADAGEGLLVTNDDDLLWRVDAARGFLPSSEESSSTNEVLGIVARLAREIPCSCATRGLFRSYVDAECDSLSQIDDGFVETLRLTDLERLRSRLAFVAAAYARGDAASAPHNRGPLKKTVEGDAKLSNALDQALGAASRRLGRPKRVLCLTDLVSCNRDLADDAPPPSCRFLAVCRPCPFCRVASMAWGWTPRALTPSTLHLDAIDATRAPAQISHKKRTQVPEEDSLYASLYAVHRTTPQIIDAIEAGRDAMRLDDARALSEALTALKQALRATAEAHHFDREASRGERVVMRRLRHFLLPAGGTDSDLAAALYNGFDSALLSSAWRFLGAPVPKIGNLQPSRDAARRTMPRPHRDYLLKLSPRTSVRARVLATEQRKNRLPVHALAVVEAEFNACLDELLRVCSRRSQLVCRYLPNYAAEFRRDEFEHDRRALLEGRLSAVRARRLGNAGDESPERKTDKSRAFSM
jgi:indoleamine 2,3-dioxygenase